MDDLFFNFFNDEQPLDPLIEEDQPDMMPVYNSIPDDPPFLLDDGIIPDSDEVFAPQPRKRRFMDHRNSIFTIIRETPEKEPTQMQNKFLEKRKRAAALRMNAQNSGESMKQTETPPTAPPKNSKKYQQKMRNRISAQTSRDRKKNYINLLERQNADLRRENKKIRDELEALQDEISKMRERCATSTAESGAKTTHQKDITRSNGNSSQGSNNGSQNNSRTLTEDGGNQSDQYSEEIFRDQDGYRSNSMSGNSLFLSLFSVLSVCAIISMTSGPMGLNTDGLHAQADRLRVLAALQPRCANYGEQYADSQAMYNKILDLKQQLNASKVELSKHCIQPIENTIQQIQNLAMLDETAPTAKTANVLGKSDSGRKNLRSTQETIIPEESSTGLVEYNNSTDVAAGTLFCPSGVIVSQLQTSEAVKNEAAPPVVAGSIEALEMMFGADKVLQVLLPMTNLTVLTPMANGQSEMTRFGNVASEGRMVELVCRIKEFREVY